MSVRPSFSIEIAAGHASVYVAVRPVGVEISISDGNDAACAILDPVLASDLREALLKAMDEVLDARYGAVER